MIIVGVRNHGVTGINCRRTRAHGKLSALMSDVAPNSMACALLHARKVPRQTLIAMLQRTWLITSHALILCALAAMPATPIRVSLVELKMP
jgi:hypothetical protein